MASIKGDLSVMPLSDLLQWIELSKKTGTITVNSHGIEKKIYVEDGKILYVSSNKEGERLGEFIHKGLHLEISKIKTSLLQSQTMKIPFTQRLIELNYFTEDQLRKIIRTFAKEILLDAVTWKDGWVEFIEGIVPNYVMKGPIKLNTTEIIFEIFKEIEDLKTGFKKI
ncbi:MAG: DUF4388 domain-containing protein [Nitrospirae bacterium]|jgi:hypothetical protein|nr:DUF4388 domain-containing protein [Nitrospirota bacterium]